MLYIDNGANFLHKISRRTTTFVNVTAKENVYTDDATAIAVLNGIYTNMAQIMGVNSSFTGLWSISALCGLSADEFGLNGQAYINQLKYYRNTLTAIATPEAGSEFWNSLYPYVYRCNAAIEGLSASHSLTPKVREQLLGEARFLRAFYYFYLVNLFGDVPLALTTDYKLNSAIARTPREKVYVQVIADLMEAKQLLSSDFLGNNLQDMTFEKVRPTKWAALALLARVHLYTKDYAKAEVEASEIINNEALFNLTGLNEVFLKNSNEAIWQLQPTASF